MLDVTQDAQEIDATPLAGRGVTEFEGETRDGLEAGDPSGILGGGIELDIELPLLVGFDEVELIEADGIRTVSPDAGETGGLEAFADVDDDGPCADGLVEDQMDHHLRARVLVRHHRVFLRQLVPRMDRPDNRPDPPTSSR